MCVYIYIIIIYSSYYYLLLLFIIIIIYYYYYLLLLLFIIIIYIIYYYYYLYYLLLLLFYIYIYMHMCACFGFRGGALAQIQGNVSGFDMIWLLSLLSPILQGRDPAEQTVPPSKRLSIYYWKAVPPISLSKLYRHYGGTVRRIPQHVPVGPHGLLGTGNCSFTRCRSTPQQLTRWWWAPSKKWSARSIRRSPSKSSCSRQFVKPPTWAASTAFGRPVAPVAPVASPVQMWSHQALRPSPAESWPLRAHWDCCGFGSEGQPGPGGWVHLGNGDPARCCEILCTEVLKHPKLMIWNMCIYVLNK